MGERTRGRGQPQPARPQGSADILVTPVRWTIRGEAEAIAPNRPPLRIWGGIPGEQERVKVVHRGEHSVAGRIVEPTTPSPYRRDPRCEKYAPCGGCPLMHVTPDGQELAHRSLVTDALAESGIQAPIGMYHGSPDGDYRHVVKLGVGRSDMQRLRVGAWGRGDRRIVPIPNCTVAAPVLRKTMAQVAHWILEMDIWPWDPVTKQGTLRAVVLRASRTSNEVMVTLVVGRNTPKLVELAEQISQSVAEVVGIWMHLNEDPGNNIYTRDDQGVIGILPLRGRDWIEEKLNGVTYRIGPGDFFQTNPAVAEVLFQRVVERLDPTPEDVVIDLYCGVGGITLQAAGKAGFVLGIEEIDGAIARAKESTRINRSNAEFQVGQVVEVLPELAKRFAGTRPLVSVNPARRGLEEGVVQAIAELAPARVVYVSCNPKALARDIAAFQALGFRLEGDLELFDMFPNTAHVEVVATLLGPESEEPKRRAPRRRALRGA